MLTDKQIEDIALKMRFEDYWENYGELHASMCGGDIKQFAKEIWMSANVNTEELKDWYCCATKGDGHEL